MSVIKYNKRLEALRSERSSFIPLWRELSDYHLGNRGRFLVSNRNKGYKRNTKQYNNTSYLATRTLASGMMSGIVSPSRPWFRLALPDSELAEVQAVKEWLHAVERKMYHTFAQSNFYNSVHQMFSELGVFGTAPMGIYDDPDSIIHCTPYTVGSYMLGMNGKNQIDTMYREYQVSVGQLVKKYGLDQCSKHVQNMWKNGTTEAWIDVVHLVEPNDDRDHMSPLAKDMAFRSVYYEKSIRGEDKFLLESGFKAFPIVTARWEVTGEDVYATNSAGIVALGDTKALQLGEKLKYKALEKLVDPPLKASLLLKAKKLGQLRGGEIVYMDSDNQALESIYGNYRPDIGAMDAINKEAEFRIKRAFFEDLFMMLSGSDRRQITAREVEEKHSEKLLMIGPVLERLHGEMLDPVIDIVFEKLQAAGELPPPPEELINMDLQIDYISVLAQAQKSIALGGLEQLVGFAGSMVEIYPDARHKIKADQVLDEYAEALGVPPSVIRSDEEVAEILDGEAQQRQAQQQQEAQTAMADQVNKLANAPAGEDSMAGVMADAVI